jgi:hypothetical protein
VCVCSYTHPITHLRTHARSACTHADMHAHMHTCMHTCMHVRTHTACTHAHMCTHAHTHARMHACISTRTHARTHARTRTNTHMHARWHAHIGDHTLSSAPDLYNSRSRLSSRLFPPAVETCTYIRTENDYYYHLSILSLGIIHFCIMTNRSATSTAQSMRRRRAHERGGDWRRCQS